MIMENGPAAGKKLKTNPIRKFENFSTKVGLFNVPTRFTLLLLIILVSLLAFSNPVFARTCQRYGRSNRRSDPIGPQGVSCETL